MPAKRSRRGESIAAAAIALLIALCFGGYYLSQAIYKANEPQLFEDSTQAVNAGEPMSITYREIGKQCNYVRWYGDVEMTVRSAVLYDSYFAFTPRRPLGGIRIALPGAHGLRTVRHRAHTNTLQLICSKARRRTSFWASRWKTARKTGSLTRS